MRFVAKPRRAAGPTSFCASRVALSALQRTCGHSVNRPWSIESNVSSSRRTAIPIEAGGLTTINVPPLRDGVAHGRLWHPALESPGEPATAVVCRERPIKTTGPPMATRQTHVGKPRLLHQLIEPRALLEMAALPWYLPMLARAPRGDGHPVLLLPGFMADEGTLIALKLFLQNRGYEVADLGLRAQRRLQQPARQRARAEDPLHAPQERPQGEPRGLEPGRHVRHVRRARGAGVRALGDHARQPGDVRSPRAASRRRS